MKNFVLITKARRQFRSPDDEDSRRSLRFNGLVIIQSDKKTNDPGFTDVDALSNCVCPQQTANSPNRVAGNKT